MTHNSLRDPRYPLVDPGLVQVSIDKKSERETVQIGAVLVDLSRRGLQLKLVEPLERGERVRLTLTAEAWGCELHSYARVRWVESDRRHQWLVGCALEAHIHDDSIDALAKDGAIERRQDKRQPVSSFPAQIKFQLEPDFKPVQLLDMSAGGFSALSSHVGTQPGDRVLVEVSIGSESHLIPAKVSWVNDFESGQAIGCAFADDEDHLLMRAAAFGANNGVGNKLPHEDNKWSMIGLSIVLIIFLFQLFWL